MAVADRITTSPFDQYRKEAWPFEYHGTLVVGVLAGGVPTDPKVAEGWLKTKLADTDDLIRAHVAEVMSERSITAAEAVKEVDIAKHLNGFKRQRCDECPDDALCREGAHELFIEGRQLKAALKEAASVAVAADKISGRGWGRTNKGLLNFMAEHVMVVEDRLYLGVTQATGVMQRFVHTFRGNGISYEEFVREAVIDFKIIADYAFTDREWAMIWLTGEQQGIGASRGQGYGRYTLTRWEQVR